MFSKSGFAKEFIIYYVSLLISCFHKTSNKSSMWMKYVVLIY